MRKRDVQLAIMVLMVIAVVAGGLI